MTASDGEAPMELGPVRRVLVVKLSSLGDIVHATPCLRALRGRFREAEIVVAIERRFADVLRESRFADALVEAETGPAGIVRGYLEGRRALAGRKPFDLAIDLQGLARSAGWVYASGARVFAGRGRIRPGWRVASTPPLERHAVEVSAAVLGDLGIAVGSLQPEISTSAAAERALEQRLASLGVETAGYLLVNPFSRWASKAWPIERWAELIPWLVTAAGGTVLLSGGRDEEAEARALVARLPAGAAVSLVGRLTLAEALCLYRRARLLLTGDTGPMHAAAALGTPVVALFGPTLPERTGPYGDGHVVLQRLRPESHHAYRDDPGRRFIRALDLETVRAGVARALGAAAR